MARRAVGVYLALALLLAPMLGLMHGLVHGAGGDRPAVHLHIAEVAGHAHQHRHDPGWLADLFSAHADDSDCRVFDQLSHSDVLPALPLLALPMVLSSFVFHFLEGEILARWAALFEARGPPPAR